MERMGVTALTSIDAVLRDITTFTTLSEVPRVVVVRHELSEEDGEGRMRRVVSDATGVVEDVSTRLEHACLSCALREDLMPTLLRLAGSGRWDHALLALPIGGEPLPVVRSLVGGTVAGRPVAERLRLNGVVAVTGAETLLDDLFGDDLLADRGLQHSVDDRRAVAEVLAHQLEQADLVLVEGLAEHPSVSGPVADSVPVRTLLAHLVARPALVGPGPHDVRGRDLLDLRTDTRRAAARADPLAVAPTGAADADGVWTLDLCTWRPLHPQRLQHEIEAMAPVASRSRGRFWLPGRPAAIGAWDGGGGQLSVGEVGHWGDLERSTRLVVTGLGDDLRSQVADSFDRVVLTDAELAKGRQWWLSRDDGFDQWMGERDAA